MREPPERIVGVGVARIDGSGVCVYANEEIGRLLGLPPERLLGDGWRRLAQEVPSLAPARWDSLRSGPPVVSIARSERSDGGRAALQVEPLPELDAEGRVRSVTVVCVDVTDRAGSVSDGGRHRERADARLREIESIYAHAPVGLALVDRDLRYVRVNQAIADMNGLSVEEVVGRSYRDLSPESADVAEHFLGEVAARGRSVRNLEVRARPPVDPEHEHVYLLNLDPVRDARGEVAGLLGAVQDVTDLRRAERIAARRLEQLELVYANAPVGLCHMDPSLRVLHLNARFARLSGVPLEDHIGRPLPDLLPEAIFQQLVPQLRQVAWTGMACLGFQVRGRPPGPIEREATWIASIHPARRDGVVTEIIAVLQDVTALAERQRELETVRDRLDEAQRVSRIGSWEWNLLEDDDWWSPELYEILGEPRVRVPSYQDFVEHVHPADRPRVRQQIERTLLDGEPHQLVHRILRGDGSERVLLTVVRLERTSEGRPARLVGTCQDTTELSLPRGPRRRRRRRAARH